MSDQDDDTPKRPDVPRHVVEAMIRAASRELGLEWRTLPLGDVEAAIDAAIRVYGEAA